MAGPIRVLFVCTGNSARSQLAEALLERAGGERVEVESAGTDPKGVHPLTLRVLGEIGIDWSAATSTSVATLVDERWDYVVTVCDSARQACPLIPGAQRRVHWDLADPAAVEGSEAERLAAFRATRDEIAERTRAFLAELDGR